MSRNYSCNKFSRRKYVLGTDFFGRSCSSCAHLHKIGQGCHMSKYVTIQLDMIFQKNILVVSRACNRYFNNIFLISHVAIFFPFFLVSPKSNPFFFSRMGGGWGGWFLPPQQKENSSSSSSSTKSTCSSSLLLLPLFCPNQSYRFRWKLLGENVVRAFHAQLGFPVKKWEEKYIR